MNTELDNDNRAELLATLRESRDVRREVNLCWMPLKPERLVRDLYADPAQLAEAASWMTAHERRLLVRERSAPWTHADVPLLDEAAELLGEENSATQAEASRAAAERRAEIGYARGVLEMSGDAASMLTADALVDRYAAPAARRTAAEHAAEDREWAFGHVVVDEAQELSAMQWRLLMRRCPSRSMTIVGDVAQTGALAGARSWNEVLDPYVAGRWQLEELTVNYRTPQQIMVLAADVLTAAGIASTPPTSARVGDWPPTAQRLTAGDDAAVLATVRSELDLLGAGRLAVIAPRALHAEVAGALGAALPDGMVTDGSTGLDAPVSVLTVTGVKGLEFDAVVLLDPAAGDRRVTARPERPLRGAHPGHPAAARAAQRRPTGRVGPAAGVGRGLGCRAQVPTSGRCSGRGLDPQGDDRADVERGADGRILSDDDPLGRVVAHHVVAVRSLDIEGVEAGCLEGALRVVEP